MRWTGFVNVLMVSPLYHPYVGGAETHTRSLAEGLARLGHGVGVITDRGYADQAPFEIHNKVMIARTTAFGLKDPASREVVRWEVGLFELLDDVGRCLERLRAHGHGDADVVHAQGQGAYLIGAVLARELSVPLLVTSHETLPFDDRLGRSRSQVLHTFPEIAKVIVGSEFFLRQALASGVERGRISFVPYGLDVEPQEPAAPRLTDAPLQIVSVGRFKPRKNQLALVDAVRRLREEGLDVRCALVGRYDASSKDYYDTVVNAIAEAELDDHVTVLPDVDDAGRRSIVARSHLVVQPAEYEGFGLAALEAILAGRVTVAAPNEGFREIFGRHSPLLASDATGAGLAAKIRDVLSDQAAYAAESARLREIVRCHNSVDNCARHTAILYEELTARRG